MRVALVLALLSMTSVARADAMTDAKAAFQAFVDRIAAKQAPPGLDTFIGPAGDEDDNAPPIDDLGPAAQAAGKPLKVVSLGVARSGTGAWIAATLGTTRASAFLVKDAKGWHVTASHWSLAKAETGGRVSGCGNVAVRVLMTKNVPEAAQPVADALAHAFYAPDGHTGGPIALTTLSDDRAAEVFGSAPKEQWLGGDAIKKVFKAWKIDLGPDDYHERAGIASGGDLAWITTGVTTNQLCKEYRAMFVLQKEGSAWKIVHQHYSEPQ